jgi:HupE / UreJ protein
VIFWRAAHRAIKAWANRLTRPLAFLVSVLGFLAVHTAAHAHLMVAQKGTLNFVGNGGFVVMSLPVDAFKGIDDDGDGRLSREELRAHASNIEAQVFQGLQLVGDKGPLALEGLMLNLSPDDKAPFEPARDLVVLGRFALTDAQATAPALLRLRFTLFGKSTEAQQQTITVTQGAQKQKMVLTTQRDAASVFPSDTDVLLDNALLGGEHVLGGLDHLLFLLVVLSAAWSWRGIVLALTCFTLGHAITLAAVVLWDWRLPASIVEPAIAATIVGMAMFDRWSTTLSKPLASGWRLSLVFACALIHGLGLASALTGLNLDTQNRLLSLVGFNVGIEAAQLGVALLAALAMGGVRYFRGPKGIAVSTRLGSFVAISAGLVWFVQRTVF